MMKEQKVGVLAIVKRGDKFLFVKRNRKSRFEPGKWGFVGEAVEYKEDLIEALKRGLKEEVSLELKTAKLVNAYSFYFTSQYNDKERHVIVLAYICTACGKVTINEELEDFGWYTLSEAKKLDLITTNRKIIKDLEKWLRCQEKNQK
ncbi:MAG: NUDIX domain-containing protein [Candidatus Aenigmatarchaeota archaeon]